MDKKEKENIMETKSLAPASLSWRDGSIPLLAVTLAWVFWECFDPARMGDHGLPHAGVLALVVLHFGAALLTLGKRAHIAAGGLFCMAAALTLGLCCALYQSDVFVVMNSFVILLTAALATFALSGQLDPGRPAGLLAAVRLSFAAFFTRLDRPFRALGRACRGGNGGRAGQLALAVIGALPVLAAALWLLSSADAVFGSLFARLARWDLPENAVMRAVRLLLLALFLCSALYFIRENAGAEKAPEKRPAEKARSALLFLPVTALLDVVYIIFCVIQIRYLFGGRTAAAMAGGWAEYARTGFFQLMAVAALDLGLCLLAADGDRFAAKGGGVLRALLGLLLALTAVILFSAFWRMGLYIDAYGMSVLRLLTLWAMAVVGFGLLGAARKLARPRARFFRAAGSFALALWCALCLANPCGLIARYNVDHYLSGQLEQVDAHYLRDLGRDALPALRKLQDAGEPGCGSFIRQLERDGDSPVPWAQWCLSQDGK